MKKIIYVTAIFILAVGPVVANTIKDTTKVTDVVIDGQVLDTGIQSNLSAKVKVIIRISTFPTSGITSPAIKYVIETDNNHRFKFILPSPGDRCYMQLDIEPTAKNYWTFLDNIYILEKGDRIHCKLSSDLFEFSGKGAAKLQCQSELYKLQYKPNPLTIEYAQNNEPDKVMNLESRALDSIMMRRISIVRSYAAKLGKEMTDILIANCYGLRYYLWLRTGYITSQTEEKFDSFINSQSYKTITYNSAKLLNPAVLINAPIYCDFIYQKICVESLAINDWKSDCSQQRDKYVFDKIVLGYSGLIREKLLTIFCLKRPITTDYIERALKIVTLSNYKKLLNNVRELKMNGQPFYPFALENDKGKVVRLSDFKDKVLIIDFWFTGCGACKQLNEAIEPVVEKYRNNSNVKFVSVCIDATKSMWLQSISKNDYTHQGSINLYAGGKDMGTGNSSGLITNYQINSYPTMFLVANGKMYSYNPPIPLLVEQKNPLIGNTKKLIELIKEALGEKNGNGSD